MHCIRQRKKKHFDSRWPVLCRMANRMKCEIYIKYKWNVNKIVSIHFIIRCTFYWWLISSIYFCISRQIKKQQNQSFCESKLSNFCNVSHQRSWHVVCVSLSPLKTTTKILESYSLIVFWCFWDHNIKPSNFL